MKKLILFLLLANFLFSAPLIAQHIQKGHQLITRSEADSIRVLVMNREMHLTTDESKKFWPIYDAYLKEMQGLDQVYFKKQGILKKNIDHLNDKDLNSFIVDDFDFQQRKLNLKIKYNEILRGILPIRKLAHFYIAQDQFSRQLIRYRISKGVNNAFR